MSTWYIQVAYTDDIVFNYPDGFKPSPLPQQLIPNQEAAETWKAEVKTVNDLNVNAGEDTTYKLLLLMRSGEAYHNIAQAAYTDEEWKSKWMLETTDDIFFGALTQT